MRKIEPLQITVFVLLLTLAAGLAAASAGWLVGALMPAGELRGVVLALAWLVLLYAYAVALFRLGLGLWPLPPGPVAAGSRDEFVYHVYILSFLLLFYPLMRSGLVPVPLMRVFYLAMGARLGANTYSAGILYDPPFVEIGANTIVGEGALVVPHTLVGSDLRHDPIRIGSGVTIGARAVVMGGCEVGDRAVVAVGSVLLPGTRVEAGEFWAGAPARRRGMAGAAAGAPVDVPR